MNLDKNLEDIIRVSTALNYRILKPVSIKWREEPGSASVRILTCSNSYSFLISNEKFSGDIEVQNTIILFHISHEYAHAVLEDNPAISSVFKSKFYEKWEEYSADRISIEILKGLNIQNPLKSICFYLLDYASEPDAVHPSGLERMCSLKNTFK